MKLCKAQSGLIPVFGYEGTGFVFWKRAGIFATHFLEEVGSTSIATASRLEMRPVFHGLSSLSEYKVPGLGLLSPRPVEFYKP